ncbi:serine/threonine-protein kinase [Streptomyces mirabilis]|uniref:serine/threonine-protein kinase n=1 Tax=Streptomyces mirabilis TaxID=68239 RepID=UPI0036DCDF16
MRVLARMLAAALREVHAAGLVHRDAKPANVLLAVDGPRLIDFGIARATDETAITSTDLVVGTPGFLSPEQAEARGVALGPASDIFSLGRLLAYAASGRPPFGTGTEDALLYRTVHDEPDPTGIETEENAEGDEEAEEDTAGTELLTLLHLCLAKDPADRPTAEQIRTVLLVEDAVPEGGQLDWLSEDVTGHCRPFVRDAGAPRHRADRRRSTGGRGAGVARSAAAPGLRRGGAHGGGRSRGPVRPARPGQPGGIDSAGRQLGHRGAGGPERGTADGGRGAGARCAPGGRAVQLPQGQALRAPPETADDGGSAGRAQTAARKLIQDTDVLAVLGPTNERRPPRSSAPTTRPCCRCCASRPGD